MATGVDQQESVDSFDEFFREYYREEIGELARNYPSEQKSLFVDWEDLYRYDRDLAEQYLDQPEQLQRSAEEALRVYDLPIDVSLGQAHVRVRNIPEATDIREIRADDVDQLIAVRGIVRKATDVRPKCREAAFRCVRCETLTRVEQNTGSFQEPHECRSCERQGPFHLDERQSEFVDAQRLRVQESPEGLRGGETPQAIDIDIEDDVTGEVTAGDHVTATGVLRLDQDGGDESPIFDVYMEGVSVEVDEEQFEDMDITADDERSILELSERDDVYDQMIGAIAPSIHGYDQEKLAMTLQLFSGVTKHLPDESRIRGDLHILLIGDPGTGKSQLLQYVRNIAPRSVYTSGKGSSSAGLTAAAVRDDFGEGQQWSLEAGALVLADQGVAAVDELDKMRCVTGDTLVHLGDGRLSRIRDLAFDAAEDGTIEALENGRTIRDVDLRAWTMAEDGRLVQRPVTAIHEYDAPSELTKVTLVTGESVTSTPDHPYFVFADGSRVERAARDLSPGDEVYVPESSPATAADGGSRVVEHPGQHPVADGAEVRSRQIDFVETFEASDDCENYIGSSVYDLSVEGTHNFVANGMVVHNSEDRSAMHEALEQQSISISKAGINATLKSRCSLLGAANPLHGRFDQYEPMGEQIDLEPALISRFDLIFTVTDEPDPEADAELAEHILEANYAGQLNTQRQEMSAPDVTREEVAAAQETVEPTIDPELLRKYVAYAQQNCYPRMTDEARERIRDFYVELRSKGADEDAPVPVTARKLEALVRLAEASARVRLADRVAIEDAERVIEIVRSCLQDIGVDPETGQFDADIVETGTSKTQRDRIKNLKALIDDMAEEFEEGVPVDQLLDRADEIGIGPDKAERELEKLKQKGEVYEPRTEHVLTT